MSRLKLEIEIPDDGLDTAIAFMFSDPKAYKGDFPIDDKGNTLPGILSKWELSGADLRTVNKTKSIWLCITGTQLPPVSLYTENPFVNQADENVSSDETNRLPEEIFNQVHQVIGEASMCWETPEKAGVFKSEQAAKIAKTLCDFLSERMFAVKQ